MSLDTKCYNLISDAGLEPILLKGGRGQASGFIMRMMAENKKKHSGQYKNPSDNNYGSTMKRFEPFDYKKLANSNQGGLKNKGNIEYGASPFIIKHFKESFVPFKNFFVGEKSSKETAEQRAWRLKNKAKGLLNRAKELVGTPEPVVENKVEEKPIEVSNTIVEPTKSKLDVVKPKEEPKEEPKAKEKAKRLTPKQKREAEQEEAIAKYEALLAEATRMAKKDKDVIEEDTAIADEIKFESSSIPKDNSDIARKYGLEYNPFETSYRKSYSVGLHKYITIPVKKRDGGEFYRTADTFFHGFQQDFMGGINQYIEKILISNGYKKNLVAEDYNKLAHILYACYSIDYECRRLLVLYKLYTKEETEEYGYNSIMRKWFGAGYGSTWKYFNKNTILGLLAALKNEMSSTEETTKMWDFYGFATVEKHWKEGKGVKTDMGNDMRLTSKTERMN